MIKVSIDGLFEELDRVCKEVEDIADKEKRKFGLELARIGEEYVAGSRGKDLNLGDLKKHQDWTHNLQHAHSYVVYFDGKPLFEDYGMPETKTFFNSLREDASGFQLIVGNGMEYASWVEGKGFNVTQGGLLFVENKVRKLIQSWQG